MAYSKEIIAHIAMSLGISVKDFEAQFADEKEIKLDLPEAPAKVFQTTEDFETYNTNLKAPEFGRGVDEGKKNATEVFIKGIKEEEGLDLTGSQLDKDNLLGALKNKYGGDKKGLIDQFEKDKALLLTQKEQLEETYTSKFEQQQNSILQMKLRGASLDGVKAKTKFDKSDGVDIIMKDISVVKDAAGKEVIHYKGVAQKDDKLEPLSMSQITDNIYIEKKWYADEAGRGAGHGAGQGTTNEYKAFVKEMSEKGVHQGSVAYQDELNSRLEDKEFAKSVADAD